MRIILEVLCYCAYKNASTWYCGLICLTNKLYNADSLIRSCATPTEKEYKILSVSIIILLRFVDDITLKLAFVLCTSRIKKMYNERERNQQYHKIWTPIRWTSAARDDASLDIRSQTIIILVRQTAACIKTQINSRFFIRQMFDFTFPNFHKHIFPYVPIMQCWALPDSLRHVTIRWLILSVSSDRRNRVMLYRLLCRAFFCIGPFLDLVRMETKTI